jgi:hypothetical protein
MTRVRARRLEETTYSTPEGQLTVAIVLTEDNRIGIYEWDEEHGYFPLIGLYTPEPWENIPEPPPFHRRPPRSISPGRRDWDEWSRLDYSEFAKRVNAHEARTRELPIPARTPRPRPARARRSDAIRCPFCKAPHNESTQIVCAPSEARCTAAHAPVRVYLLLPDVSGAATPESDLPSLWWIELCADIRVADQ